MMGETSYYNPATVFARQKFSEGAFGRVFYSEGDYVHDMDLGFYAAYQYSGGENWKATASYPPMLYPTHAIGGILGAVPAHAVSVSCLGVVDDRQDGVFDKSVSQFGNEFSNASALFELSDGGILRTNEMRRVGYPSHIRESRFRFLGTEGSFEQVATASLWQTRQGITDVSELLHSIPSMSVDDPALAHIAPELRPAFVSGHAPIHDTSRLLNTYGGAPNGHEGSHQFLVDDFVVGVTTGPRHASPCRASLVISPHCVAVIGCQSPTSATPHPRSGQSPWAPVRQCNGRRRSSHRRAVTRAGVARYAQVSSAVVSYVVNDQPKKVAPATAARDEGGSSPDKPGCVSTAR
jgi:hypothetical protein